MLGAWRIVTAPNGSASIQVEEYKRPTFEVSFKEPNAPLRLNKPATLTGEARYYFGLPVTSGKIRWSVSRAPVYPLWWGWWGFGGGWDGPSPQVRAQVVASGTSTLEADGTFQCVFTPEVDERNAKSRDVTFRYVVTADVTNGGETRSAEPGPCAWVSFRSKRGSPMKLSSSVKESLERLPFAALI